MTATIFLDSAIEAILDAMVSAIAGAVEDDQEDAGPLAVVKSVVRGDRARPMPKLPSLWVVPEPATNDSTTLGLAEDWTMPVRIAALVNDDDPDAAGRLCVRLAALARSAVLRYRPEELRGRRLGLAYVNDVKSAAFDASARRGADNRNLHWSDATVTVHFRIWEAT